MITRKRKKKSLLLFPINRTLTSIAGMALKFQIHGRPSIKWKTFSKSICSRILSKAPSFVDWKLIIHDLLPTRISRTARIMLMGMVAYSLLP